VRIAGAPGPDPLAAMALSLTRAAAARWAATTTRLVRTPPPAATAAAARCAFSTDEGFGGPGGRTMVVSLTGPDRVGVVADFSSLLSSTFGANVEASRMAQLGGDFALILQLRVDADAADPAKLQASLSDTFPGFAITARETAAEVPAASGSQYTVELEGPDSKGIVAAVTEALVRSGANVGEMKTEVGPAPFAGYEEFRLAARVHVADERVSGLGAALEKVQERFGVVVALEAIGGDK